MTAATQEDWQTFADCRDSDPERWFALDGPEGGAAWNRPAIEICQGCPVRLECTIEGKQFDETHAVRGGFRQWMERDRRARDEWLEQQALASRPRWGSGTR